MVNLLGRDDDPVALDGLRLTPLGIAPATSQFDSESRVPRGRAGA